MGDTQTTSSGNGFVPHNREAVSFRPGEMVGVYRILSLIGKGGAGEVFKVEHTLTKRIEAIKVLSSEHSQEAQRFLREVQIHASLSHPNIASVHNAFWAGEDLVMAMEFVEGDSLRRILERGRIPLSVAIDYVRQALSALTYAHARQVTHRDITPGNMLVTPKGTIKLTDFGLAKLPTDVRLTKTGMMVGSLYYMSPEQVRAVPDVDPRSDLYSVGAVLYEMVTGAKPFDGDSAFAIMLAQVGQDPPAPISLEPALPLGLNELILRALAKDPCDRFQSALEFRLAVESIRHPDEPDCQSVERTPDGPSNRTELNSLPKRIQEMSKKAAKNLFRFPRTANTWNGVQFSMIGPVEPVEVLPALISSWPGRTIHPKPGTPKWQWFGIAASVLAVVGSVFATRTWQRIGFTPPVSAPVTAKLRVPQQLTTPVAAPGAVALPPVVLQPLTASLTLNMSAGNAALNDNPVLMRGGVSTQNLAPGDHSLPKKPGFTDTSREKVRLVRRTPQTINVALVPTVTSLAAVDAPDTQILIDGAWTGIASSTGVLDVSWETEQDFRSGEKLTAPGKGRVASDTPSSETVATASFEPIAPSRLHKILNRMSPARVVHRHEKVGFIPAKPIHEATPRAPLQLMRGARGQVSADIRVTIDKRGKVTSVNLEPAAEKGPLPEAAMAAAWNWTFTPARKGSNPVESQANLHFRFQNPEFASANR